MTPDTAKAILSFVADCIERESATTKKVLLAVPDAHSEYAPHEKCMKALDLAWHIASAEQMFMSGIVAGSFAGAGEPNRPAAMDSAAKIADWYTTETAKNIAAVRAMTPEQATHVINFHNIFELPAFAWAQLSLTHAVHHRGQLSAYLRPMGAKVPGIYGPSADEPLAASA